MSATIFNFTIFRIQRQAVRDARRTVGVAPEGARHCLLRTGRNGQPIPIARSGSSVARVPRCRRLPGFRHRLGVMNDDRHWQHMSAIKSTI